MFSNKLFCRLISNLILLMFMLVPCSVFAEEKYIIASGEYNTGKREALIIAKERAVSIAMINAIKQAGVYDSSVFKDEFSMITSDIIQITDKKFDVKLNDTGESFVKVTITCKVYDDKIRAMINNSQDKASITLYKQSISDLKQKIERSKQAREEVLAKAIEEHNHSEEYYKNLAAASQEIEEMIRSVKTDKVLDPLIIGDSSSKVLQYYGKPEKVNRTVTQYSVSEQWVYGNGIYIYIENGLVVAWQD